MVIYNDNMVRGLQSDNPWWFSKPLTDIPSFKRSDYFHYIKEIVNPKIVVLLGPRRCGKTTLILQVIQYLLVEKSVAPNRILFVSLDRPYLELYAQKLQSVIAYYEEKILRRSLGDSKELVYLFIDEAHYDSLWSKILKQYADQNLPVYAVVSGSSAAAIYQGRESAAGRFYINQMVTLKFRDIVRWYDPKNESEIMRISTELRRALLKSISQGNLNEYMHAINQLSTLPTEQIDLINRCVDDYLLRGGYPEFHHPEKPWNMISRHYQTDVFDVILQKDVVTISHIRNPNKIRALLVLIAQNTAKTMAREKIIESLGLKNKVTVDNYIDALSEAFLVRSSARFKKAKGYPSTSPKKYYAADTGLRNAVLGIENIDSNPVERGYLLETAVFNHCLRLLFNADHQLRQEGSYWEEESEKDIILDFRNAYGAIIPIEVKNGNCGNEHIKALKITMSKLDSPFGIIICNNKMGIEDKILLLPAWIFLLSC